MSEVRNVAEHRDDAARQEVEGRRRQWMWRVVHGLFYGLSLVSIVALTAALIDARRVIRELTKERDFEATARAAQMLEQVETQRRRAESLKALCGPELIGVLLAANASGGGDNGRYLDQLESAWRATGEEALDVDSVQDTVTDGLMLVAQYRCGLGDCDGALRIGSDVVARCQQELRTRPGSREVEFRLLWHQIGFARFVLYAEDWERAEGILEEIRGRCDARQRAGIDDSREVWLNADLYSLLAGAQTWTKKYDEAELSLRRTRSLWSGIAQQSPELGPPALHRTLCLSSLAKLNHLRRELDGAESLYREAYAEVEPLCERFKSAPEVISEIYRVAVEFGEFYEAEGRAQEAVTLYQREIDRHETLRVDPLRRAATEEPMYRLYLALACANILLDEQEAGEAAWQVAESRSPASFRWEMALGRARALSRKGEVDQAIRQLDGIIGDQSLNSKQRRALRFFGQEFLEKATEETKPRWIEFLRRVEEGSESPL